MGAAERLKIIHPEALPTNGASLDQVQYDGSNSFPPLVHRSLLLVQIVEIQRFDNFPEH